MLYREINRFMPIESVVRLKDSAQPKEARRLVEDYKASSSIVERMARDLVPVVALDS